jgi:hypothetical protein
MFAKALILAAVVAVAAAQIPSTCATPKAWTARTHTYDHGANRMDRGFIAYDALNERVRFSDDVNALAPGRKYYEEIVNYRTREYWNIDISNKECKKGAIPPNRAWHAFGIPDNATFVEETTIGAGQEYITTTQWEMPAYRHPAGWMWIGSFTLNECVPVHEVVAVNVSSSITRSFYDISIGVQPDAFIPPSYCPQ